MREVRAVVLAAGLSRRFGGPNKLLQPWRGTTVIACVVETLLACGLPVYVVTGRDAELVAAQAPGATPVFNPDFEQGMGSSLAAGVRSLPPCDGILVVLGDMPDLRRDVIRSLLDKFEREPAIIRPIYEAAPEEPGHPILFPAAYRPGLEALQGDSGARSLIDKLVTIRVPGSLPDLDYFAGS